MSGISRRLPQTDEQRQRALNKANATAAITAPADRAITATTLARIVAFVAVFNAAILARAVALAVQGDSTTANEAAKEKAKMFISHFFQVFFLGVERGVYPASAKAYFGLDLTATAVPSLGTEAEILEWGLKIKNGDIARLAAGGTAMSNPTTAEVNTAVDDFTTANNPHITKMAAYDTAQEAVEAQRDPADKLIKKTWGEVETFYVEDEIDSSRRRKCRPWGVIYESSIANTINVHVQNIVGAVAMEGAIVSVLESDNTSVTDAAGNDPVKTTVADEVTIRVEAPGFVTQDIVQEFETGTTVYDLLFDMVAV